MIQVEDADAVGARVVELGGRAMPAFDIPGAGRMAVCFDPNGAEFDTWQAASMRGTDVDSARPGAFSWFETMTDDTKRAAEFYTRLFGWTAEPQAMPGVDYTVFKAGDAPVAGMLAITPEMGRVPPHWATYFTVDDCDAAAHRAVELGGSLCLPLHDIPGVGHFCALKSPQGVFFYVIAYPR